MNHSTPIANPIMKTWNSGSQPWLPNRPPTDSLNCKSVGYRLMAKTGKQGHNSGSYIKIYIISLCIIYKNIYNIYSIYIWNKTKNLKKKLFSGYQTGVNYGNWSLNERKQMSWAHNDPSLLSQKSFLAKRKDPG